MSNAYILLGGNLGDRSLILKRAIAMMEEDVGNIEKCSSVYETEPWGYNDDNSYLNQVVILNTELSPKSLLHELLQIESKLGRKRDSSYYASRAIDLDILFYDDLVINMENLIIPHPLLEKRMFTLAPLNEIASELMHPRLKCTIKDLIGICDDKLKVRVYDKDKK